MNNKPAIAFVALLLIGVVITGIGPELSARSESKGSGGKPKPEAPATFVFSYDGYAALLKTYVDGQGMVNYKALQADRGSLDSFVGYLGRLSPETYKGWIDKERIAFWINAYNALTLAAIIDHYPIESSFIGRWLYPENSIRQISGVWDEIEFTVMGEPITLDSIEHEMLREIYNEPRIHMALVCAAMGCPPLRKEPYIGGKLDAQLGDQARKFLADPKKFKIVRDEGEVYLSPIFKWFGGDFVKTYRTDKRFLEFDDDERAVLNFISGYLRAPDKKYLSGGKYDVEYLDYDWSLNERK